MTLSPPSWLRPSIEARTKFIDEQVLAAIGSGVRQIVVCGAGYDDRALRFRSAGVRFFELDHPSTQADKQRRLLAIARPTEVAGGGSGTEPSGPDPLRRLGVTLAAADFRSDEVATVLGQCGHNRDTPSLFICEGLLVYLDEATCRRLLGGLAASATERSVLVATLATHADGLDSAEAIAAANARRRTADAEPWRTILPAAEHLRMLQQAGWAVTGVTDSPVPSPDVSHGRQSILVRASPAR